MDIVLPRYVSPLGERPLFDPPLTLHSVSLCYMPLEARYARLGEFIDNYLNDSIRGPENCPYLDYFEPAAPYVFLGIANYDRIANADNTQGAIEQKEIFFTVPLNWWKRRTHRDAWYMHDYAFVSPFIYVDDVESMESGREVFGWPKTLCKFRRTATWTEDPLGRDENVTVYARGFDKLYAGKSSAETPLLRLTHEPGLVSGRVPPNTMDWFSAATGPLRGMMENLPLMRDVYLALLGPMFSEVWGDGAPRSFWDPNLMAKVMSEAAWAHGLNPAAWVNAGFDTMLRMQRMADAPIINMVNLKQFRGQTPDDFACYKAITNGPMRVSAFTRAGMLGLGNQLLGERHGGYWLDIQANLAPVVETLGVIPHGTTTNEDGVTTHSVRPLFPFWMDVDLNYLTGSVIDNRTFSARDLMPVVEDRRVMRKWRFNTVRGAAEPTSAGQMIAPSSTLRVLPLLAEQGKMQALVDELFNHLDMPLRLVVWGHYVFLTISSSEDAISAANPVGTFETQTLEFHIPVHVENEDGLQYVGTVCPFSFAGSEHAAITATEVFGQRTKPADFISPRKNWIRSGGPNLNRERHLLDVQVELLPALYRGQKTAPRTLLSVRRQKPKLSESDTIADEAAEALVARHDSLAEDADERIAEQRKLREVWTALELALEIQFSDARIRPFALKQFRDAADVDRACYQALVAGAVEMNITKVAYDRNLVVDIARYPTQPIAQKLGLVISSTRYEDGRPIDTFRAKKPFYLDGTFRSHNGEVVYERLRGGGWRPVGPLPSRIEEGSKVGPGLASHLETNLVGSDAVEKYEDWLDANTVGFYQSSDIRDALSQIEPMTVICLLLELSAHDDTLARLEELEAEQRELAEQLEFTTDELAGYRAASARERLAKSAKFRQALIKRVFGGE